MSSKVALIAELMLRIECLIKMEKVKTAGTQTPSCAEGVWYRQPRQHPPRIARHAIQVLRRLEQYLHFFFFFFL
jgi:hypothetical protein